MMKMDWFKSFLFSLDSFFLWYFGAINVVYMVLLILGSYKIFSRQRELNAEDFTPLLNSSSLPPICFIIPMYNEADHVVSTVTSILHLTYRYKQIIVVNDGSIDHSVGELKKAFDLVVIPKFYQESLPTQRVNVVYRSRLHPELVVIDKEHGRKSDALNAGINACEAQYFIGIDSDTLIDDIAFKAYIRPFLFSPETIAVGGTISISNDCYSPFNRISTEEFPKTFLTGIQSLEYLRAFFIRQGWDFGKNNFILSGAFCIFRKDVIVKAGGFYPSNGEDMEIIMRLHRIMKKKKLPYKIFYLPDPVAWTKAPSKLSDLGKQRTRWHRGLLECLFFHKSMCFNPTYGVTAFLTYPFWLLGEAMEPIMEVFGFAVILLSVFLGILNFSFFLLLVNITLVFTFIFSVTCLFIEELSFQRYPSSKTLCGLLYYSLLENFGYRQLYLWWRIRGFGRFFQTLLQTKKGSAHIKDRIKNCDLGERN